MQTQPFTGIMPSQFAIVQLVFDEIVQAPWFHDTEEARESCSVMVLQQYRKGYPEQDDLLRECLEIAKQRYGA
jgi:hypothetical protein